MAGGLFDLRLVLLCHVIKRHLARIRFSLLCTRPAAHSTVAGAVKLLSLTQENAVDLYNVGRVP